MNVYITAIELSHPTVARRHEHLPAAAGDYGDAAAPDRKRATLTRLANNIVSDRAATELRGHFIRGP